MMIYGYIFNQCPASKLELRSHIHLIVVMLLLAQKVLSYLLGGVLCSFIAKPLLSQSFFFFFNFFTVLKICCGVSLSVSLSLD